MTIQSVCSVIQDRNNRLKYFVAGINFKSAERILSSTLDTLSNTPDLTREKVNTAFEGAMKELAHSMRKTQDEQQVGAIHFLNGAREELTHKFEALTKDRNAFSKGFDVLQNPKKMKLLTSSESEIWKMAIQSFANPPKYLHENCLDEMDRLIGNELDEEWASPDAWADADKEVIDEIADEILYRLLGDTVFALEDVDAIKKARVKEPQ